MPTEPTEAELCRSYLIKRCYTPQIASLFTTWEQVRRLINGYTVEQSLDNGYQPAESYHCKEYLIKCFLHPAVATLFTTWEQVRRLERGFTEEESLYMQRTETFSVDGQTFTIPGYIKAPDGSDFF